MARSLVSPLYLRFAHLRLKKNLYLFLLNYFNNDFPGEKMNKRDFLNETHSVIDRNWSTHCEYWKLRFIIKQFTTTERHAHCIDAGCGVFVAKQNKGQLKYRTLKHSDQTLTTAHSKNACKMRSHAGAPLGTHFLNYFLLKYGY